jgi:hypothetical protein
MHFSISADLTPHRTVARLSVRARAGANRVGAPRLPRLGGAGANTDAEKNASTRRPLMGIAALAITLAAGLGGLHFSADPGRDRTRGHPVPSRWTGTPAEWGSPEG